MEVETGSKVPNTTWFPCTEPECREDKLWSKWSKYHKKILWRIHGLRLQELFVHSIHIFRIERYCQEITHTGPVVENIIIHERITCDSSKNMDFLTGSRNGSKSVLKILLIGLQNESREKYSINCTHIFMEKFTEKQSVNFRHLKLGPVFWTIT